MITSLSDRLPGRSPFRCCLLLLGLIVSSTSLWPQALGTWRLKPDDFNLTWPSPSTSIWLEAIDSRFQLRLEGRSGSTEVLDWWTLTSDGSVESAWYQVAPGLLDVPKLSSAIRAPFILQGQVSDQDRILDRWDRLTGEATSLVYHVQGRVRAAPLANGDWLATGREGQTTVLVRFSADGNAVWSRRYSSPHLMDSLSVDQILEGADGGLYVVEKGFALSPAVGAQSAVLSLTAAGEFRWGRLLRGGIDILGTWLKDVSGGVVLVMKGRSDDGNSALFSDSVHFYRWDPAGDLLWARRFGTIRTLSAHTLEASGFSTWMAFSHLDSESPPDSSSVAFIHVDWTTGEVLEALRLAQQNSIHGPILAGRVGDLLYWYANEYDRNRPAVIGSLNVSTQAVIVRLWPHLENQLDPYRKIRQRNLLPPGEGRPAAIVHHDLRDDSIFFAALDENLTNPCLSQEVIPESIESFEVPAEDVDLTPILVTDFEITWEAGPVHEDLVAAPSDLLPRALERTPICWDDEPRWWINTMNVGGGWRGSWLGQWSPIHAPWYFHEEHRFFYAIPESPDRFWLYTLDLGWLWTADGVYPWLWQLDPGHWLFYQRGSRNPRNFWNSTSQKWFTVQP